MIDTKNRNLEETEENIEINFYNSLKEEYLYTTLKSDPFGLSTKRNWFNLKEEIGISLVKHLIYFKEDIEKDNLETLILELIDTILHELLHYIGDIKLEYEDSIKETTRAMMFRDSLTLKWIVDIKEERNRK